MTKRSFVFTLTNPVLVNTPNEVRTLTCFEPTNLHQALVSRLRSMLMKIFTETAKEHSNIQAKADGKNAEIDGEVISYLITLAPGQDEEFSTRFYHHFECLLLSSNICQTDKQRGLDKVTFDQFVIDDVDALIGEYVVTFLMPSVISQASK